MESSGAADILTAVLSRNEKLHLVERNEIERVYREQGLSAANEDFLKLGQLLGADGLFLLEVVKTAYETNLTTRLIAVKPGVVLASGTVSWPLEDTLQWAEYGGNYLNSFVPKLSVLAKDAIPVSVINLRSAVQSAESTELERQLTALMIRRLGQERDLFVLERQRMELLSTEKELKGIDPTAFWNGSYLLEGVLDRDGYSREQITVNSRLVPPAGGMPIEIAVAGPRNALAKVVEQLAVKILESLRRTPTVPEWKSEEEAAKFFDEARWALKWGMTREAQSASESAWALGRRDRDCAAARVRSYVAELPLNIGRYQPGSFLNGTRDERATERFIREKRASHPEGFAFERRGNEVKYLTFDRLPDPRKIGQARRALELYHDFSRTLSPEAAGTNSWLGLGLETLEATSMVLQHFCFFPESRKSVAGELADLRERTRLVASWISRLPPVRNSFWVGERTATHDELAHSIGEGKNIFRTWVDYGCFWQETPEDCIVQYRELMSSPVFCYIHGRLWERPVERPRLVAWSAGDQRRIPTVWQAFMRELNASTNFLLRLEAKAVELADADNDEKREAAYNALISGIFSNAEAMVSHNVDLLYLNWGVSDLLWRGGALTPVKEKLERQYRLEHSDRLAAMEREYWKRMDEKRDQAGFEAQKAHLTNNTPYEFGEFSRTFSNRRYTKGQAAELQPLLSAYTSNLAAQAEGKPLNEQRQLRSAMSFIRSVETAVNRALNSTSAPPARPPIAEILSAVPARTDPAATTNRSFAAPGGRQNAMIGIAPLSAESATNVLGVKRFVRVPQERLHDGIIHDLSSSRARLRQGKLLLDLWFSYITTNATEAGWSQKNGEADATAIWNPATDAWQTILQPESPRLRTTDAPGQVAWQIERLVNSELLDEALYCGFRNQIRKYPLNTRQWESLPFPGEKQPHLFAVNGRLFAANDEALFEILDGGKATRLLASTRRRPAVSVLDSLETLGTAALFPGPDHSLRAGIQGAVYSWNGSDWNGVLSVGQTGPPEVFEGASVLRRAPFRQPAEIWLLPNDESGAELCWREEPRVDPYSGFVGGAQGRTTNQSTPTWKTSYRSPLAEAAVTTENADLYFFAAFADLTDAAGQKAALEQYGRHADLVCLQRDSEKPLRIPLRFGSTAGVPPVNTSRPFRPLRMNQIPWWILFARDSLVIGHANAPGFWTIPRSELDEAIAREKQLQRRKDSQLAAAAEQRKQILLAKYDRNNSGAFDPEEIENALADPDFVEFVLDTIDANQDNRLQAAELAYFDANRNRGLDTNEEAGIDAAQRLLAARMFKKVDDDQDGQLSRQEFAQTALSSMPGAFPRGQTFSIADKNHDERVDPPELEAYLRNQTRQEVVGQTQLLRSGRPVMRPLRSQTTLKESVEVYWNAPETPRAGP